MQRVRADLGGHVSAADDILNALADLVAERVADRLRAASALSAHARGR